MVSSKPAIATNLASCFKVGAFGRWSCQASQASHPGWGVEGQFLMFLYCWPYVFFGWGGNWVVWFCGFFCENFIFFKTDLKLLWVWVWFLCLSIQASDQLHSSFLVLVFATSSSSHPSQWGEAHALKASNNAIEAAHRICNDLWRALIILWSRRLVH